MIKRVLRHIRHKPKAVREQYAFWIACVLTAIVVVVWLAQVSTSFTDVALTPTESQVEQPSSFAEFVEDTQEQIAVVRDVVQSQLPAVVATSTASTTSNDVRAPSTPPTNQDGVQPDTFPRPARLATSTSE